MTLLQLNYLVAVAESGSINRAAGKLFVSQSGMSAAIRDLEKEMGITIFRRDSKGVRFTDEGYRFYEQIRPIVEQEQQIVRRYDRRRRHPMDSLRVSAQHYPFAVQAFVRFMQQSQADGYDLRLREDNAYQIIEDVASGDSDLGLIFLSGAIESVIRRALDARDLTFHTLGEVAPHVFMRRGHPLAQKAELSTQDLTDYPYAFFGKDPALAADFSEEVSLDSFTLPGRLITVNDRCTMYSVIAGSDTISVGTGLLPDGYSSPDIIAVPIRSPADTVRLGWIQQRGDSLSPAGEIYIGFLREALDSLLDGKAVSS